jgi:hypothetical protein
LNPGIETDNQELGGNFNSGHQDYFPLSQELFAARDVDSIAQQHQAEARSAPRLGLSMGTNQRFNLLQVYAGDALPAGRSKGCDPDPRIGVPSA